MTALAQDIADVLAPCPFCGSAAMRAGGPDCGWVIECRVACTSHIQNETAAIAAWSRRSPDLAALVEDRGRLRWLVAHELLVHRMSDSGLWMIVSGDLSPAIDGGEYESPMAAIDAARAESAK